MYLESDLTRQLLRKGVSYPKVIPSVHIPLDEIPVALWEVRTEPMLLADAGSFLIASLLMSFIVAVLWIDLGLENLVSQLVAFAQP